ncbi:hypothetical protein BRC97_07020 [Halobacteriales archaeon QS_6_71_20]|nr:MAG: hypothetical protein BRC97_07020 [Halobacteriales archaeon QS_6_71_20]
MHLLISAASGWGKGWIAQALTERNIRGDRYHHVVVLDTSDEFRGLCSRQHGPGCAKQWTATATERDAFGAAEWRQLVEAHHALVIGRGVAKTDWREDVVPDVILGCRESARDVLLLIDEAHGVAPQSGGYPKTTTELATDGRSEGGAATSSMWLTQRLAQTDKDVTGNCTARFLGGFEDANSLNSISDVLPYQKGLHASGGVPVSVTNDDLLGADGEAVSVRKWTELDENGEPQTVNSEWIYTDETGKIVRKESNDYNPRCEHVGASGKRIDVGV